MLPIPRPPLTHRQKAAALTAAGVADFLQIMFLPTVLPGIIADEIIDFVVALILIAICGFKWQFGLVFFVELIPGLSLLPTWSAVVLTLPSIPGDQPQRVRASVRNNRESRPAEHPPICVTATPVPPVQAPPIKSHS